MNGAEDLFPTERMTASEEKRQLPLAVRMRPLTLDEIVGQRHLLGPGKLLRRTIQSDRLSSAILYGPPGTGKTTIAWVISKVTKAAFISINAVESNVSEMREIIKRARLAKSQNGPKTLLFIDEIHRFNKAQQDILMPVVEEGVIILIGATTLNPSFVVNGPLLSRTVVFELRPLSNEDLNTLAERALSDKNRGLGSLPINMEDEALNHLVLQASGDARRLLNAIEIGALTTEPNKEKRIHFNRQVAEECCQRKIVYHDKKSDYHYDTASAFIKSMRGSDVDAAVYWLAKMLYAGEDPRFIIRRIIIFAAEDIGNADPQALILASAGLTGVELVGMPEARIILGQLVTYMSLAPKSNASYMALENASEDVAKERTEEVPTHLRDSHSKTSRELGHGSGYKYAHDFEGHIVKQAYINKNLSYYNPSQQGFEKVLEARLKEVKARLR